VMPSLFAFCIQYAWTMQLPAHCKVSEITALFKCGIESETVDTLAAFPLQICAKLL